LLTSSFALRLLLLTHQLTLVLLLRRLANSLTLHLRIHSTLRALLSYLLLAVAAFADAPRDHRELPVEPDRPSVSLALVPLRHSAPDLAVALAELLLLVGHSFAASDYGHDLGPAARVTHSPGHV